METTQKASNSTNSVDFNFESVTSSDLMTSLLSSYGSLLSTLQDATTSLFNKRETLFVRTCAVADSGEFFLTLLWMKFLVVVKIRRMQIFWSNTTLNLGIVTQSDSSTGSKIYDPYVERIAEPSLPICKIVWCNSYTSRPKQSSTGFYMHAFILWKRTCPQMAFLVSTIRIRQVQKENFNRAFLGSSNPII